MTTQEHPRTKEQRLRRAAKRRGFTLSSNGRRDPLAPDYGQWTISRDGDVLATVKGLDAVEHELDRLAQQQLDEIEAQGHRVLSALVKLAEIDRTAIEHELDRPAQEQAAAFDELQARAAARRTT